MRRRPNGYQPRPGLWIQPPPAVSIRVLFVLIGVMIATIDDYFPLLLRDRGFEPDQIGLLLALMAGARFAASPVWGHVADAALGRVRTFGAAAYLSTATALLLFLAGERVLGIVLASVAVAASRSGIKPLSDAIAMDRLGERNIVEIGRFHLWDSAGFMISVVGFGALYGTTGLEASLLALAAAALVVGWWSGTIPRDSPMHQNREGRFGTVGAALKAAPRLVPFLAGWLLVSAALFAAWDFLPLQIVGRGGALVLVGLASAVAAVTEVPVLRWAGAILRRLGLRGAFALGCAIYMAVFSAWGLVRSPVAIALLNLVEGAGYAVLSVAAVVIVGRLVPVGLRATGQSLIGMVGTGLAPIFGGGVGGLVFAKLGAGAMFIGAAIVTAVGAIVAWVALPPEVLSQGPSIPSRDSTG